MSVKIMGQVWDLELSHNELIVLLAMADHADHEGNNVYPSIGLIAWKTGYSDRTIQRVIKSLVEDGILICVDDTSGYVRKYRINIAAGTPKKPYKSDEIDDNLDPRQNVTPDTVMSPDPRHSYVTPTPDTAMSPESSIKPSIKPSDSIPDKSGAVETKKLTGDEYKEFLDILKVQFKLNGGMVNDVYHQLRGSTSEKRKHIERYRYGQLFRDNPVTMNEIRRFPNWYRTQCPELDLPTSADSLENWFGRFRQATQQHDSTPQWTGNLLTRKLPTNIDSIETNETLAEKERLAKENNDV